MKVRGLRWIVLSLIALVTIINYLDRGTLNYMWVANTKQTVALADCTFDEEADTYTFQADAIDLDYLNTEDFLRKSGSLRGSVMIVGPLVARFGKALIPKPGGDKIGRRRLDTHFVGIQKLGACFSYDAGRQLYEIEAKTFERCLYAPG